MTRAALENGVGAAFFPGIEATNSLRTFTYVEPFRFDQSTLKPGDVTANMARPWQNDFYACAGGLSLDQQSWWPAARPDSVVPQSTTTAVAWTRNLVNSAEDMVASWHRLGFIVDPGTGQLVETERTVVCKDCFLITDRSTIGKDEVDALLLLQQPAVVDPAFYVVVEGFKPSELGITTPTPTPAQLQALASAITLSPAVPGMSVRVSALKTEDPALPDQPQRFTFFYQLLFASSAGFVTEVETVTLTATIAGVSNSAPIVLTLQPNPYVLDGPISWLSTDLRVFQIQPGGALTGLSNVTMGNTPADASPFIKAVITAFNGLPLANHPFDKISTDQQTSRLELSEKVHGTPVFNFAICRVRYRANALDATNVRVFFRLFQTAATGTNYNLATTYRRGGQPGVTIPLLGVQGGELVTIPCFAEPRVDPTTTDLNMQKDPANVQTLVHNASGAEVDAYFGCWLDINQPSQPLFPIQPTPINGPFGGGLMTIQQLIRGLHQCLVAEVAFDPDPIPNGVSPAASDKLAQRNLAIVASDNPGSEASHRIQHTFTIEPTRPELDPHDAPDELLIDWGLTPVGSTATLYLPGLRAAEILDLAGKMYDLQTLERVDDHTLRCKTGGVTYIPVPSGVGVSHAGLLTVDLPAHIRKGQAFTIVVRQVTTSRVALPPPPPEIERGNQEGHRPRLEHIELDATLIERVESQAAVREDVSVRRVRGTFQITIPVRTSEVLLEPEEQALSVLLWILQSIPQENRWFLVFHRYVQQTADRVKAFGGDPRRIKPSPSGDGIEPGQPDDNDQDEDEGEEGQGEKRIALTGKVMGLTYDRFGDFEGFILDTEDGARTFISRETRIEELVQRAWTARTTVTVLAEHHDPHHPASIILRVPPSKIEH